MDDEKLKRLQEATRRANAEAAARRDSNESKQTAEPSVPERGGRDGPEPTRYGDWEKSGIICDF
jgi:hypothetical protein